MKTTLKKILLVAIVLMLSSCKYDTPESAADEYCRCVNDGLNQEFELRQTTCLTKVGKKYGLLKRFFENFHNDRIDTIDKRERKTINKFGLAFEDAVQSKCCETGWGCRPGSR